jgi:hypothetical protein
MGIFNMLQVMFIKVEEFKTLLRYDYDKGTFYFEFTKYVSRKIGFHILVVGSEI